MRLIFLVLLLTTGILFSCKNDTKQPTPLVVTMTEAASKKCVHDTICAEIKLSYPVLTGGLNPVATQAINDSLLSFVYMVIGGNPKLPLPQAFDSASLNLYMMLQDQLDMSPDYPGGFTNELSSKVLYQNVKLISVEMSNYSFTGGAHGSYGSALNTFLLANGKALQLTDIVQDSAKLRPLLEQGFVAAKNVDGEHYQLTDLVFPESLPLPLPMQWCIVKEGLRLTYNPYEVAPYAVGQTDIVLSWDQLGSLADKKKWVD
ncbi:MAG: DUF3298 and DUF4163 domain-containing protein [Saprospiraceae bacterium]|jgi:hypothetical protein|nr:DUF3298 and DUF4163 domain-containing protein [Saprospiraceae bacterium]